MKYLALFFQIYKYGTHVSHLLSSSILQIFIFLTKDMESRSFFFLVALLAVVLTSDLSCCNGARLTPPAPASTKFITSSCQKTAYPALCMSSLSSYSSKIQSNPVQLATTALSLSLDGAQSASTMLTKIKAAAGGRMNPAVAASMNDCMEVIGDSLEELRASMAEMGHLGGRDLAMQISNVQTWVSASITDDDTCMDEFAGQAMDEQVKTAVRGHVVNVAQLTSNALAFVNALVYSP